MSSDRFAPSLGRHLVAAVLFGSMLPLAACDAPQEAQAPAQPSQSSVEGTVGPASVGETVTVGPYEMCLTRGQLLADPQVGPDRVAVPPIPEGHVLAEVWVTVRNPSTAEGSEELPAPDMLGFRLVDKNGQAVPGSGVGLAQSGSAESTLWDTPNLRPIRPGEHAVLVPSFVVPADSAPLTLFFTPLSSRPNLVVEFKIE